MIFCADNAHIHFFLVVQLVQQNFRGGAGGDDDGFILQIREIFNRAAFFHQQTGTDNENGVGERCLFLTFKVVGGGTAFEIISAVLQQRNTVL